MSLFSELAESIPSSGGNYLKFELGDNRIRVVSKPIKIFRPKYAPNSKPRYCLTEEGAAKNGCPDMKFAMWVIDRRDNCVKVGEFGSTIMGCIADLSETEGYKFDILPHYDFIVKKKKEGDKVDYNIVPFPTPQPVTAEEEKAIKDKGDLVLFLREKAEDKENVPAF